MSTDSPTQAWIEERRAIHAAATEGPWQFNKFGVEGPEPPNPDDRFDVMPTWIARTEESHEDATAIVDAHNMLPRALDALNAVLELHHGERDEYGCWTCRFCSHIQQTEILYPCATVRAVESALEDGND